MRLALAFLALSAFSIPALAGTDYPLTVENCGLTLTFDGPPQRVVAIKSTAAELLLALGAVLALPVVTAGKGVDVLVAATRALALATPPTRHQIGDARFLIRERRLKLRDRHLRNGLGLFGAGHDYHSRCENEYAPSEAFCQVRDNRPL